MPGRPNPASKSAVRPYFDFAAGQSRPKASPRSPNAPAKGDVSWITIADVLQSNGIIHVVDTVLLPM
jgi:hypothetical protein